MKPYLMRPPGEKLRLNETQMLIFLQVDEYCASIFSLKWQLYFTLLELQGAHKQSQIAPFNAV